MSPIPILLYGKDFWTRVVNFEALADEGVISPADLKLFHWVETAEEGWAVVQQFYKDDTTPPAAERAPSVPAAPFAASLPLLPPRARLARGGAMDAAFAHVDSWIFDLDNTLYPAKADLFALIDVKMGEFIQGLLGCDPVEARETQKRYFLEHGTTLSGLMHHHGIEPRAFLDYVHDISMDRLERDEALIAHVAALPGRRLIFTNGDAAYAGRVLAKLGLADLFEQIHDIHACQYVPKPDPSGYAELCRVHGLDPARSAFFEDMARNLKPAKAIGMTTIWVNNGSEAGNHDHHPDFIDFETDHLTPFLAAILKD